VHSATRYLSTTFSWIPRQNCFPDIGASNGSLSRRRPKIPSRAWRCQEFGASTCGPLTGRTARSASRASTVENMRSTAGQTIWASAHGEICILAERSLESPSVSGEESGSDRCVRCYQSVRRSGYHFIYSVSVRLYSGRRLYVCRGWSREARDKVAQSDLPWHLGHPTEYPSRGSGIANC
jgi:hypothetical protein